MKYISRYVFVTGAASKLAGVASPHARTGLMYGKGQHLDAHAGARARCHAEAVLVSWQLQHSRLGMAIWQGSLCILLACFPACLQIVPVAVHLLAFQLQPNKAALHVSGMLMQYASTTRLSQDIANSTLCKRPSRIQQIMHSYACSHILSQLVSRVRL